MDTAATPAENPFTEQPEAAAPEAPSAPPVEAPQPPSEQERVDELIETVQPSAAIRSQRIFVNDPTSPYNGFDKTYVQKPLSFFGKTEFVRIVGKAIDAALSGEDGTSVTQLIGVGSLNDLSQADVFIKALARLAEYAPDLLKSAYMISLGVPRHERDVVSAILDMPQDDEAGGGLSDDDGFAIMETFVAQNAKALSDFFTVRLRKIVEETTAAVNQTQDS